MIRVIIESPYAGDVERNTTYARRALCDSLHRGEAPFASHLLYTQDGILDDANPDERKMGILAGFAWGAKADLVAVYADYGISAGMKDGIAEALRNHTDLTWRRIGPNPGKTPHEEGTL